MTDDELPIERGFPIERVNEIAEKESRAKMHYRPIYTMHKWWARRLGCVFRAICLYSLLDDPEKITVYEPGSDVEEPNEEYDLAEMLGAVTLANSESLWELYSKDVRVEDKKILDPFMGGGTSLVEASRFGVESIGYDLNPVAWFVTKKEIDAGQTDVDDFKNAFEQIRDEVADDILQYYKTPCPNVEGTHDADVMYNLWVKELDCTSCGSSVPLFNDYRVGKGRYENDGKYNVFCPSCEEIVLCNDWKSETECDNCGFSYVPQQGTFGYGEYTCVNCGQKYGINDAVAEQNGYDIRLYAVEYYCEECENNGRDKSEIKSYKPVEEEDRELFEEAKKAWNNSGELHKYVPSDKIRPGWKTASTQFEGSAPGAGDLSLHGYSNWTDFYNERQLLCLSKLLKAIDELDDQNLSEFLLLAFTDSLRFNSLLTSYQAGRNHTNHVFKTNSFDPPQRPAETNVWGTEYGMGMFKKTYEMVKNGIEYANAPTERHIDSGETKETEIFNQPIGQNCQTVCEDMQNIDANGEFDAIITDPPYYDNVMYAELSDFFYVWQRIVLSDSYTQFEENNTPRAESIVANPAEGKSKNEFEDELLSAFETIYKALKKDGVLSFTYHHSDSESWGELLASLCDAGFEVTATYPISADAHKFITGEAVEFDILIVARPSENRDSISWPNLRQQIYETARETRQRLEENRDLSRGDIGVVEMGECFHEYSKHHGNVHREGDIMSAKEVVDEIYGIIQEASEIGATEVFIDLLREDATDFDAVNKLCRGANTRPEELKDLRLFNTDDGFELGTWDSEERIAYLEDALQEGELSDLGKLQYLRYRYDRETPIGRYVRQWIDADLRELAGKLASATGDEIYEEMLEMRSDDDPPSASDGGDSPVGPDNQQSSIDDFS